jgi:uncharacterized tellurite resistance protein B-like protein
MSILDLFGIRRGSPRREETGDTETVRRIIRELESLEPERARYLAAFAFILARVAHADLEISGEETRRMEQVLQAQGHLPLEQAVLAVQIAKAQHRLAGGTENFLVTREFREIATKEQCRDLLDCLFAVSAADDSISAPEEAQIRQIASELGFDLTELVGIRSAWAHKRDVLKGLPGGG